VPQGTQLAVMPPGQHQKHSWAGGLARETGMLLHSCGPRNTHALVRDLVSGIEVHDTAERYTRLSVVVDHSKIH
jgi:hypothetical protein